MKFLLVVYICSAIEGECRTPPQYPSVKKDYYDCVHHGLGEAYVFLYGWNVLFSRDFLIESR